MPGFTLRKATSKSYEQVLALVHRRRTRTNDTVDRYALRASR
jgi:predicted ATPase